MNEAPQITQLLKAREVCELLRCSRWVLKQLLRDKKLPAMRIGTGRGTLRFRREDVEAFIRSSAAA